MKPKPKFQFSIASLLFAMFAVAFVVTFPNAGMVVSQALSSLVESLGRGIIALILSAAPFTTILVIQLIAALACVEILSRNIPARLARAQRRNCQRHDGSWSERRQEIELASLNKLRGELLKAFFLVGVATNAVLYVVHLEVIPIPIAFDAMASFSPDEEAWKANLRHDQLRYDRWGAPRSNSKAFQARKRTLFRAWPVALLAAMAWGLAAFGFIGNCYAHGVKRLSASVKYRAQRYRLRELHETVGSDDFAKAKQVRRRAAS